MTQAELEEFERTFTETWQARSRARIEAGKDGETFPWSGKRWIDKVKERELREQQNAHTEAAATKSDMKEGEGSVEPTEDDQEMPCE